MFDVRADAPDVAGQQQAAPGTVLVLDGIFLHRPELRWHWSWSLWLEAGRATTLRRCVARDGAGSGDPADASNRRYVLGQQLYVRKVAPARHATRVVDNDDLAAPVLVR